MIQKAVYPSAERQAPKNFEQSVFLENFFSFFFVNKYVIISNTQ